MVQNNGKRAFVALSGGVDSSVCALLLKNQGYEVVGITGMMTHSPNADIVAENAKQVAVKLGIEHHVVDVSEKFRKNVIDYFENAYIKGETPNPCIVCNKLVKWGALFDYAVENGADIYATGHYAEVKNTDGFYKLYPAKDRRKDQLYFLFGLNQEQLSKTVFPLQGFEKSQIRQIAEDNNLPSKSSKDSQDICFIEKPENSKTYLFKKFGIKKGDFIDVNTGKKLGEHDGYFQFTIGQRKGIGVSAPNPLYVISLDAETNTVYLGEKHEALRSSLEMTDVSRSYPFEYNSFDCMTKIRYNMPFVKAHVEIEGTNAKMEFEEPVYSVTPGQAAVWYDIIDGHLLGGAVIR